MLINWHLLWLTSCLYEILPLKILEFSNATCISSLIARKTSDWGDESLGWINRTNLGLDHDHPTLSMSHLEYNQRHTGGGDRVHVILMTSTLRFLPIRCLRFVARST